MISRLFALPLRALVIAAMLPIPPALGADLAGQSPAPPAAIGSALAGHFIPLSPINAASR
jgi:hypothetical protein